MRKKEIMRLALGIFKARLDILNNDQIVGKIEHVLVTVPLCLARCDV
jgi:hypothetical protein